MLKKLLVAVIASAFAMGAYAQAQKAEPAAPKGQTGTATEKATPSAKSDAKTDKKAKTSKTSKTKTKTSKAKASAKGEEAKKDTK